jgi:hypothetical protein
VTPPPNKPVFTGPPAGVAATRGSAGSCAAGWKIVSASVTGRSHLASDRGNEDAVATRVLAHGTILLALADGAGSARRAGDGSRLAVAAAVQALGDEGFGGEGEEVDLEDALRRALQQVRDTLAARACESRARPRDFACTLLLAVIHRETLAVLQLGDGAVVSRSSGNWQRVTQPLRGRHAGETVFVTSRRALDQAQVEVGSNAAVEALALLSDGLEPVATVVATGTPHGPFFDPLVAFAGSNRDAAQQELELERFLASDRLQSRSLDDLSLILAVRT